MRKNEEDWFGALRHECVELGCIELDEATKKKNEITADSEVVDCKGLDYERDSAIRFLRNIFPDVDKSMVLKVVNDNLKHTKIMKYKCISKCFVEDSVIMSPDDIVVIDGNRLFNITTGADYNNIPDMDRLKACLVSITDEVQTKAGFCSAVSTPLTNADKFRNITKEMVDTYRRKNHDYGNSFDISMDKFGLIASAVRIGDKMNRFESLTKKEAQVYGESIRDTLLDMANYAIMTVMWIDNQKCGSDGR